jgi:hypothetical protein
MATNTTTFDLLPHNKHVDWESPETTFRMYVGYLSLLFDIGVLTYHFTTPFHPKVQTSSSQSRKTNFE